MAFDSRLKAGTRISLSLGRDCHDPTFSRNWIESWRHRLAERFLFVEGPGESGVSNLMRRLGWIRSS